MTPRTVISGVLAFLAVLASPVAVRAESGMYRVEVLVFMHLENQAEALETQDLRSFSGSFDLVRDFAEQPAPYRLDVMSSTMEDSWRRLRNSPEFRPLVFASWEQTRIDYHPPVRIHDEELIAEQLEFPYEVAWVDLRSDDPFDQFMVPYFRLDGTAQLTRSRFLHLELDLEFRQDLLPALEPGPGGPLRSPVEEVASVLESTPGPALVHRLKQSRQVRTGQMQYFDSPYLGVLARVTATSGE